jgi:hypothetical protein
MGHWDNSFGTGGKVISVVIPYTIRPWDFQFNPMEKYLLGVLLPVVALMTVWGILIAPIYLR